MPIQIGAYELATEEEFDDLWREHHRYKSAGPDPSMVRLLQAIEETDGAPVRIALVDGQQPRSVRSAIANSARARNMKVQTVPGDGFVMVRKVGDLDLAE